MTLRALAPIVVLLALACTTDSAEPSTPPTRPFRMGFSALPPRLDQNILVQSLELWTKRADIAIVHEELPWTALMAGVSPDSILAGEKDGLIAYYRGKGLGLVFIADANDGLSRGEEAPRLRALGRSIAEPAVQRKYRDYILAFVRRYHPEYVGLAAETNLIRVAAPAALYQGMVQVANAAAADLAAASPHPKLFVSVQVEVAWGKLVGTPFQGIDTDFADFPFVETIGLSSYPYLGWSDPADIPDDYYSRLMQGHALPMMVVEGGWASASYPGFTTSPGRQAAYFRRQAALLTAIGAVGWLQLAPTDLDVTAFPAEVRAQIAPFATLGVYDANLLPKPALAVWDSVFTLRTRQ